MQRTYLQPAVLGKTAYRDAAGHMQSPRRRQQPRARRSEFAREGLVLVGNSSARERGWAAISRSRQPRASSILWISPPSAVPYQCISLLRQSSEPPISPRQKTFTQKRFSRASGEIYVCPSIATGSFSGYIQRLSNNGGCWHAYHL